MRRQASNYMPNKNDLEKLYHQHFDHVYRTAYLVTGNRQMAEDATQEAFLKAIVNIDKLRDLEKFRSWVSVIASNCAIDLLRKNKKLQFSDNTETYPDESHNSPQDIWEKEETNQELQEAISRLNAEDRSLIVLRYFNELSIKEIASLNDTRPGTIKSRLFRAREKLKILMQPGDKEKRHLDKEKKIHNQNK